MSCAKPMEVTVLGAGGEPLGTITRRPSAGNWRILWKKQRLPPFVRLHTEGNDGPLTTCVQHGDGWAVRLEKGTRVPKDVRRLQLQGEA